MAEKQDGLTPALVALAVATLGMVVVIACTDSNPIAPGQVAGTGTANGTVTAQASGYPIPGPVTVPWAPGAVPVPGAPGGAPVPGGPNVPNSGGGASPTPGGGLGGGGTASPSPGSSPAPGSSPSPSPTPPPCPATVRISAKGVPRPLSDADIFGHAFPTVTGGTPGYDRSCRIAEVRVDMHITTATGFVASDTSPGVVLRQCGTHIEAATGSVSSGCAAGGSGPLFAFSNNATGNQLGSSCGDFVFDTTASPPFDNAAPGTPPYSGTYGFVFHTHVGYDTAVEGVELYLYSFGFPADAMLQCSTITFTTKVVVP